MTRPPHALTPRLGVNLAIPPGRNRMDGSPYRPIRMVLIFAVPMVVLGAGLWLAFIDRRVGDRCQVELRPKVDWGNCTKAQLLLASSDLSEAVLTSATLTGTDLSRSKLKGARLDGTEISGARFLDVDLTGATLSK